ncbi:rRNA maturation RNase YbeY [Rapidithrix thailandica]|uniref:Endoribonuclease YbeY n=1 Tax=Rapidithrix thailandica TaxID=413964 RepID=A0AAW9RS07_9BACT
MESEKLAQWVKEAAAQYNKQVDTINYIFCSDKYLLEINQQYLDHDTYTDIITFDNSDVEEQLISDIFISAQRVSENSSLHNTSFDDELHRVIIHGILHLAGFKDKSEKEKERMRNLEDQHLQNRNF